MAAAKYKERSRVLEQPRLPHEGSGPGTQKAVCQNHSGDPITSIKRLFIQPQKIELLPNKKGQTTTKPRMFGTKISRSLA